MAYKSQWRQMPQRRLGRLRLNDKVTGRNRKVVAAGLLSKSSGGSTSLIILSRPDSYAQHLLCESQNLRLDVQVSHP